MVNLPDIQNREDVDRLIALFYKNLLKDPEMGKIFEKIDFVHHQPKIVDFWCFVLLNESGYSTNVFDKHLNLGIREHHFEIWLPNFEAAVDQLFSGEKASLAKQRAQVLSFTFKSKMKQLGLFEQKN